MRLTSALLARGGVGFARQRHSQTQCLSMVAAFDWSTSDIYWLGLVLVLELIKVCIKDPPPRLTKYTPGSFCKRPCKRTRRQFLSFLPESSGASGDSGDDGPGTKDLAGGGAGGAGKAYTWTLSLVGGGVGRGLGGNIPLYCFVVLLLFFVVYSSFFLFFLSVLIYCRATALVL